MREATGDRYAGSSPRRRGTLTDAADVLATNRIIPAQAGNALST